MEAIKTGKGSSSHDLEDKIPMEVKQEIYSKFEQNHYEKWFKDKIPALDNKTPLQAIKTNRANKRSSNC